MSLAFAVVQGGIWCVVAPRRRTRLDDLSGRVARQRTPISKEMPLCVTHGDSPVARLLAESLTGQVYRREILKRATALGLSAPLVGIMLSAREHVAAGTGCRTRFDDRRP